MCGGLNPATLLPDEGKQELLTHSCADTEQHMYSGKPDLKDNSLPNPEAEWFTDGSSFMHEGTRKIGYAIVSLQDITEAKSFPPHTSAQKPKLIALI